MLACWLILTLSTADAPPPVALPTEQPPAVEAREPPELKAAIEIKQVPPRRAVVVDHKGPYWTVGGSIGRVRACVADPSVLGSPVVRCEPALPEVKGRIHPCTVGFLVDDEASIGPPCRVVEWPSEWVASMRIKGRPIKPWHDRQVVSVWLEKNGFRRSGPYTEAYRSTKDSGVTRATTAEIQVSLRADPSGDGSKPWRTAPTSAPTGASDVGKQDVSPSLDAITKDTSPSALPVTEAAPTKPHDESAQVVDVDTVMATLRRLLERDRFAEAASLIIPDGSLRSAVDVRWVRRVVVRYRAAARGIDKVYSHHEPGTKLLKLAEALDARLGQAAANVAPEPFPKVPAGPTVAADAAPDGLPDVVHELNVLLVRIGQRSVDAETAESTVLPLLARLGVTLSSPGDPPK